MKILHYSLGFPPYRSGGLTKFCMDLMQQQVQEGHDVAMIWPGQMNLISKKIRIAVRDKVVVKNHCIGSFEIINPLPVPFDEGIKNIKSFTINVVGEEYGRILDDYKPDVIHIHTLMGLHKCFCEEVKSRNIRMVFTAHDFFPICPKVTMFRNGAVCNTFNSCTACADCNDTALSMTKIKLLQSPTYRRLKDLAIVKKMRKSHRDRYLSETKENTIAESEESNKEYLKLRKYYYSLLEFMDTIHYNSSITKRVYESVFKLPNNCVINITHADVVDKRRLKNYSNREIRIRYLGPQSSAKGFFILKEALDKLWTITHQFRLDVHFVPCIETPYIRSHERYTYKDLAQIFSETDILVAPSIWYETFGYTVLEALSYGVPVVISGSVGAKDILEDGAGIVVESITSDKLCKVLSELTPAILKQMNRCIVEKQDILEIADMSKRIEKECYLWN